MAESPKGYFPDVKVQWNAQAITDHVTEITVARNLREQRRAVAISTGLRRFTASSDALDQTARKAVYDCFNARRGRLESFYFFEPAPSQYFDFPTGNAHLTHKIIPFTNSTITDVRTSAGPNEISRSFTVRSTKPRAGSFVSLKFGTDFATDYVACGTSATLRPTGDQTLCAWVYPYSGWTTDVQIVTNRSSLVYGILFMVQQGTQKIYFETNQAGAQTSGTSTLIVPLDQWSHVAVVRSGTNLTFYLNGAAAGTAAGINDPVPSALGFAIGGSGTLCGDNMLSDVRFYSSALTAPQVAVIAAGGTYPSSSLLGWWPMTEGTGLSVADLSGNNFTGTITGANWVAGEDEILFGAPQTGVVTVTLQGRQRMIARFDMDSSGQAFLANAGDVRAIFNLAIKEVIP